MTMQMYEFGLGPMYNYRTTLKSNCWSTQDQVSSGEVYKHTTGALYVKS